MRSLAIALFAASVFAAVPASAQSFSDTFQGSLSSTNWANVGNGQIVTAPDGGKALNFSATASGQDLVSNLVAGTGLGQYRITVDYYCARPEGCAGYLGLYPGSSTAVPGAGDAWLATDTQSAYGTPFTLVSGTGTNFGTNTFFFTVTSPGQFGFKFEDFNGGGGNIAGDAFFRNFTFSAVPELNTWAMMLVGFGMIGAGVRSRRRHAVRVTYA